MLHHAVSIAVVAGLSGVAAAVPVELILAGRYDLGTAASPIAGASSVGSFSFRVLYNTDEAPTSTRRTVSGTFIDYATAIDSFEVTLGGVSAAGAGPVLRLADNARSAGFSVDRFGADGQFNGRSFGFQLTFDPSFLSVNDTEIGQAFDINELFVFGFTGVSARAVVLDSISATVVPAAPSAGLLLAAGAMVTRRRR